MFVNQIALEFFQRIKDFGVGVSIFNSDKTTSLIDLTKGLLLEDQLNADSQKEDYTPTIFRFSYQLSYLKEYKCFSIDIQNLPLKIILKSETAVSLNDLENGIIIIETTNLNTLNQGPDLSRTGKNFLTCNLQSGGLFCGEYLVGGLSNSTNTDNKYIIQNFKVFRKLIESCAI